MIVTDIYHQNIERLTQQLRNLKRKDSLLGLGRLIVGASALVISYFALLNNDLLLWVGSILSVVAFIVLVLRHQKLRDTRTHIEHLLTINRREVDYIGGRFHDLPTGMAFKDGHHLFSEDLDLFGNSSLFQRICRSNNTRSQSFLADEMKRAALDEAERNQASVKELLDDLDWRQNLEAIARRVINNDMSEGVKKWVQEKEKPHALLKPALLWPLSLAFPVVVVSVVSAFGLAALEWLIIPFLINLFLFSRVLKSLKRDHQHIDKLAKDFEVQGKMIAQIEGRKWQTGKMQALAEGLKVNGTLASVALNDLSRILNRLDSINNAIGALLLNGICFYHLHVYNASLKWKSRYASNLNGWLDRLAQAEVLIDKANYAFNHQNFQFSVQDDDMDFVAKNLGHPFIADTERVGNDIDFSDFNIMILTGSNMAGKSTFLRSIGLAIVMSALGLPVCAKKLRVSKFKLLTSMKPQDSVNENTSYFQAEVNRLRAIMDALEKGEKCFLLLDEILRGTNSQDKRNGTQLFLKRLASFDVKGVIATHDVEIAELTQSHKKFFQNNFFESEQRDEQLFFDYRLKEGVCQNPNATALMRLKGII